MRTADTIRIGLLWHSLTSGNLGVGALTLANIAIARDVAEHLEMKPEFVVLGMRDGDTQPIAKDIDSFEINRKSLLSPSGYRSAIASVDIILDIGAGDSFAEIYGPKRFTFLWLTKLFAIVRKIPLVLSPQTIGPFTKPIYRKLAAHVMKRATAVVARDQTSLDVLRDIAPSSDSHLSVDVAFVLPFDDRSSEKGGVKKRIGINASGLLCTQAETGQNRFGLSFDYLAFTRRLIEAWMKRDDIEIHLIPHATSKGLPEDDDGHRADLLAKEFPGVIRVPDFAGPSEAKSYISSLDFLVAGRMHACIGAFSSGTAVVPVAYSRKFAGLFGMLDYPWATPVSGMDEDAVVQFVMEAFEQRDTLSTDASNGMEKVENLLDNYREILRREFTKLCRNQ